MTSEPALFHGFVFCLNEFLPCPHEDTRNQTGRPRSGPRGPRTHRREAGQKWGYGPRCSPAKAAGQGGLRPYRLETRCYRTLPNRSEIYSRFPFQRSITCLGFPSKASGFDFSLNVCY